MDAPRTVLIVDDDVRLRRSLARELNASGWTADGVGTLDEAIAWTRDETPDIAVIDLKLGDESGLDFLDVLVEACPRTLPIIGTAYTSKDICVQAMKLGAVDFLEKPFGAVEVLTAVEKAFANTRRMRLDFIKLLHCYRVLGFFKGNKTRTIQALGISKNGFRYMLGKGGIGEVRRAIDQDHLAAKKESDEQLRGGELRPLVSHDTSRARNGSRQ